MIVTAIQQRLTKIVSFFKLKNSVYLLLLSVVALFSLFLHLFDAFYEPDAPGLFGFKYMTSFLYATGIPFFAISVGLLLKYAAAQIHNEYKHVFGVLANLVLMVGCFYLFYTFIPMQDFSTTTYYTMVFVLGFGLLKLMVMFHVIAIRVEAQLRNKIKNLVRFLFRTKDVHYKNIAVKAVAFEQYHAPIDGVTALSQIDEFDNEFWHELEKTSMVSNE